MFAKFLKVLFALSLGIIPAIWVMQNDERVKQYVIQKLIPNLEKSWNTKIEFRDLDINFFTSSIYLKKGQFSFLCDSKCIWKFDYGKIRISKILSLIKRKIYLDFIFDNFTIKTLNNIQDAHSQILKHLKDIFESADEAGIDINLKTLLLNNLNLQIVDPQNNSFELNFPGRFFGRKLNIFNSDKWIISANINNGNLNINDQIISQKINGFFTFSEQKNAPFTAKFKSNFKLSPDTNSIFFAQGDFQNNNLITKINVKNSLLRCDLDSYLNFDTKNESWVNGKIQITDLFFKNFFLGQTDLNLCFDGKKMISKITVQSHKKTILKGKAETVFDKFKSGIFIKNANPVFLDENIKLFIPKKCLQLKATIDENFNIDAKYFLKICKETEKTNFSTVGKLNLNKNSLNISGNSPFTDYTIKTKLFPAFYITDFNFFKKQDYLVQLKNNFDNTLLTGNIKTKFLRLFLPQEAHKIFLTDKKIFKLNLFQDSFNPIKGQLLFEDGPLFLPDTFNLIKNFKTDFSLHLNSKKLMFQNTELQFYKGKIYSPQISFQLNDNWELNSIHSPLEINDVFINFNKFFYGIFYGNILAEKKSNKHLKITGDIIAKKSLLKDNPLAQNNNYNLQDINRTRQTDMDFELDINLSNQTPITVKTNFLNAQSNFDLKIKTSKFKDKSSFSKILGAIEIENGELDFLRNKLNIHHGKIQFLPNQINDPIINISAKNKIKKYFINMQISGTLQNPQITLESTPTLTEEQILALLMTGSENASFQTDLPAILMQNLNNWVLERNNLLPKTKNFFEKITLPFKYIQITPNFTDQTGRGGIRGTVSIDVNKQLHAQIQKNFNLQEDFAFQVEYLLSDDINLKAIKDQRGELGSEMEVKFKF
ncbi:MAG: translocation/assembly module TamB domain-containing protein [bacterium]